ncbi:MAG: helix-turn-helix transcriptional regulator [Fibromonadaceae bacterium]|jgi:transcriptional regulator with XRE-family HTH domain|nr:helix-turn-helix transcriptional regulator [Fibromonadaceae bacterium]
MGYKIGLKIFRKRLGLSQDEIAEKLDCVKTTYQSWENGRREPPVEIIRKLLILGAKVEELFGIEYNEIHRLIPKCADENFENKILSKIESLEKKLNEIIVSKK